MDGLLARAMHLFRAGQVREAHQLCQEWLGAHPDDAQALELHGMVCAALGRQDEARASLERAVSLAPDRGGARLHLGLVLGKQGRLDSAIEQLELAGALEPASLEIAQNLRQARAAREHQHAQLLSQRGDLPAAQACFESMAELLPGDPDVLCNLGLILARQDRSHEALQRFRQALAIKPDHFEACTYLGDQLLIVDVPHEAEQSYRHAVTLRPNDAAAQVKLGTALLRQNRFDEAAALFELALRLDPSHVAAHFNLGTVLKCQDRYDEALARARRGVQSNPQSAELHCECADLLLSMGQFSQGWEEYEWRWKIPGNVEPPLPQPRWTGEPLAGRTILLRGEQGFGDALQFVRFAPLVKRQGATVLVVCRAALTRLLASCPGVDRVLTFGEPRPDFDVHAPLLSVPRLLHTTLGMIPNKVPYIEPDRELLATWREKFAAHGGFKVGIAWRGNPQHKDDRRRSIPLARFAPLARVPGVQLVSLQVGNGRDELAEAARDWRIVDVADELTDFSQTAAVVRNLDLVIACDTACCHLAGALGVPVWVALQTPPEWRWLLAREDSPWYPTMRLFRQKRPGDWDTVFARMATALAELA